MENVRHHASQHVRLLAQLVTRAARISKNLIISNDERVFSGVSASSGHPYTLLFCVGGESDPSV